MVCPLRWRITSLSWCNFAEPETLPLLFTWLTRMMATFRCLATSLSASSGAGMHIGDSLAKRLVKPPKPKEAPSEAPKDKPKKSEEG